MEYILAFIVLSLLVDRYFSEKSRSKEREELIRAVIAKNHTEYTTPMVEATEDDIKEKKEPFYSIEEMDDKQFLESINGTQES